MVLEMARQRRIDGPAQLHAYIGQEQAEQLEAIADAHQTSVSDIVRRALRLFFSLPENATPGSVTRDVA